MYKKVNIKYYNTCTCELVKTYLSRCIFFNVSARESLFDSMVNLTNHLPDVSSFLKPKENLKDNLMLDPASRSQSQSTKSEGCNSGPHQPVNNYTSSDVHSFVTSEYF